MSTPEVGVAIAALPLASALFRSGAPPNAEVMFCMLELFDSGVPSMMTAVPRLEPPRMEKVDACARVRLSVDCTVEPGRRFITSDSEVDCMWSMAVRDMVDEVAAPALPASAVTTTSSTRKLAGCSSSLTLLSPAFTVTTVSRGS